MEDPGSVLLRAYAAMASGDFDVLLDQLGEREIDRVVAFRQHMITHLTGLGQPESMVHVRTLIRMWGLGSADELRDLPPREVLRRGLQALPPLRTAVGCWIDRWELADDDRAIVHFEVLWDGESTPVKPPDTAEMNRTPEGWKVSALSSSWLLPGLENILVADPE